jgi:hypothetical protein
MNMSIFFRVYFLSLVLAFVIVSCVRAETTTPSANPSPITQVPQVASEIPALAMTTTQNDLIFIDFFAGT